MRSSPLAAKIVRIFQSAGHVWPGGEDNAEIRRTYAGRHQRACGAWSWFLIPLDGSVGYPDIGSSYPASVLKEGDTDVTWEKQFRQFVLDPKSKSGETRFSK